MIGRIHQTVNFILGILNLYSATLIFSRILSSEKVYSSKTE